MSNINAVTSSSTHPGPNLRTLCEVINQASWYSNIITTESDFKGCLSFKPELENLVERTHSFEWRILNDHGQVYRELKTLLRYRQPQPLMSANIDAQVSENGVGAAWDKFQRLMVYYRLFDRVWFYDHPIIADRPIHPNNLLSSSNKSYSHIEDVQKLLLHFKKLTDVTTSSSMVQRPLYSARLSKGSGVIQQLKDLAALYDTSKFIKIQRNLLLAALSLNWMCRPELENVEPSESGPESIGMQSRIGISTRLEDAPESIQTVIECARRDNDLSNAELENLTNMFKPSKQDDDFVLKTLLIALGVTPLFLLAPIQLDKSKWSNFNIYQESQKLGNWHSELLVQIEKTILDSVFHIASGSMDPAQAVVHITNNLPWKEITDMRAEDPSNRRFRCIPAPSQPTQPFSSVKTPSTQQHCITTTAPASGIPPMSSAPPSTPPPSIPLHTLSPLTSLPPTPPQATHLPGPLAPTFVLPKSKDKTRQPNDENPGEEDENPGEQDENPGEQDENPGEQESSGDGGNTMDVDIGFRPLRTMRIRNPPSAPSMPAPEPRFNRAASTKRKRDTTRNEEPQSVPKPSKPSNDGSNWSALLPKTLPEIREPDLVLKTRVGVVLRETSPYTLYCAKGQPHEVVFKAHSATMINFWKAAMDSVQRSYVDQIALHVVGKNRSIFTVISYSALQKKSAAEKLELLRRGAILETDRPTVPISFDIDGLKSLGCSLNKTIDIQDQSLAALDQTKWSRGGTLLQMLDCPTGKALNVLSLPMPEGSHSAGNISTDYFAWEEAVRMEKNVERNASRPVEIVRWGLCATTTASHTLHIDSDGLSTYVEVLTGTKIWVVLTPKDNGTDFSEFGEIDTYLRRSLDVPNEETCEAVVLTPGTRIYMRPNMLHAVYTAESAICHGGHFYALSTMKDTLCGLIHAFAASRYITNNSLEKSRSLLRQIMIFFATELESPSLDARDSARSHLPKLNPLEDQSDDPEMNSIEAAEQLFAACSLVIFMSVLHPATYLHPEALDGKPNSKQRQEMEDYDRNSMSLEERIACVGARARAYRVLRWFSKNYRFVAREGQPPKQCQTILDEKLAEQAYAIYLAKAEAVCAKAEGYPGCSLKAVKQQLLGNFPLKSNASHILQHHFQEQTQLRYVHADFSGWDLEVVTSPIPEDDPAVTSGGLLYDFSDLTPLDIKFSEGWEVDFEVDTDTDTDAEPSQPPSKKSKVV